MYQNVSRNDFLEAFKRMGRDSQFSRSALEALFEMFIEWEEESGTDIELDVIGICCEYREYQNYEEAANELAYPDVPADAQDYIQNHHSSWEFDGGILVSGF